MICPICGKIITDNSKFCGRCGGNIIEFYNQASSALLSDAFRLLKEHKKDQAKEIIDKVFLRNAQDSDANVGKLLLESGVENIEDLTVLSKDFSSSPFYKNIMVFGDEQLKAKLQSISASLKEKEITSNKNAQYESAIQLMKECRYLDAKDSFENLENWMDAEEKARQCETLHIEYQRKLEEEKRTEAIRKAKTRKRNRIIISVTSIAIIIGIAISLATKYYFIPTSKYSEAMKLIEAEKYDEGYAVLKELGTFKNSNLAILDSKFERANKLLDKEEHEKAYELLEELNDYRDANTLILENKYQRAIKLLEKKEYDSAYKLLNEVGSYKNAKDEVGKSIFTRATENISENNLQEAYDLLKSITGYSKELDDLRQETFNSIVGNHLETLTKKEESIVYLRSKLNDSDLNQNFRTKYDSLVADYRNDKLNDAKNAFNSSGYQAAISVLENALTYIPGDTEITNAIEYYKEFTPIQLFKLPYTGTKDSWGYSTLSFINGPETAKDCDGNTYHNCYDMHNSMSNTAVAVFQLAGKYSKLSGTFFWTDEHTRKYYDDTERCFQELKIHGDGKLLYESKNNCFSKPDSFSINISGVKELRVSYYMSIERNTFADTQYCLSDFQVQK